jgi:hypothetical protein
MVVSGRGLGAALHLEADDYEATCTIQTGGDFCTNACEPFIAQGWSFSGPGVWIAEATPLPATLPLFATGLGALGLLGWRRKRKAQAAV